jgi:DNA repair protein RadD
MSLSLYYQMVGRAIRIHPSKKEAWIVDMGGNVALFGKVEHFKIDYDEKGHIALFQTFPRKKQLTNVSFTKK